MKHWTDGPLRLRSQQDVIGPYGVLRPAVLPPSGGRGPTPRLVLAKGVSGRATPRTVLAGGELPPHFSLVRDSPHKKRPALCSSVLQTLLEILFKRMMRLRLFPSEFGEDSSDDLTCDTPPPRASDAADNEGVLQWLADLCSKYGEAQVRACARHIMSAGTVCKYRQRDLFNAIQHAAQAGFPAPAMTAAIRYKSPSMQPPPRVSPKLPPRVSPKPPPAFSPKPPPAFSSAGILPTVASALPRPGPGPWLPTGLRPALAPPPPPSPTPRVETCNSSNLVVAAC